MALLQQTQVHLSPRDREIFEHRISTPVGTIRALADSKQLLALFFEGQTLSPQVEVWLKQAVQKKTSLTSELEQQLKQYFNGQRTHFDLPLFVKGSEFEMAAWKVLKKIPYGKTITYAEQSQLIGHPGAVRAIGSANGRNRFPILIPCHRVIRSDGHLGGYAGGLTQKEALLTLERSS